MSMRWNPRPGAAKLPPKPVKAPGAEPVPGGSPPGTQAAPQTEQLLDPYVRWAYATNWRAFEHAGAWSRGRAQPSADAEVQIIVRAESGEQVTALLADPDFIKRVTVAAVYGRPVPGTSQIARHFTAKLKRKDLDWLIQHKNGLRWELAMPMRDADSVTEGTPHGYSGPTRDATEFTPENLFKATEHVPGERPSQLGDTIAVIDYGCPFLHEQFAPGGQARVKAVWDQGSNHQSKNQHENWPWLKAADFGYGSVLGTKALAAMARASRTVPGMDETAAYRGIDYLIAYDDPRRRVWFATHGSHVLDIAGGSIDPLTQMPDAASKADLVFVQLPALTAADSAGGSLAVHLLDAVRYVLAVARADDKSQSRVVINISYGSLAGPHDGQSLIESALDELLELRTTNFAIVLAAGNGRLAGCHMRRNVSPGWSAMFRARLVEGDTTDTFIETWYTPPVGGAMLKARVRGPEGGWSDWVSPGEQVQFTDDASGEVVAQLRHDTRVPGGSLAMILLAVAPTQMPGALPMAPAPAGDWGIEVCWGEPEATSMQQRPSMPRPEPIPLNAWIERDQPDARNGQHAHFLGLDRSDDLNTISSLANGKHTVVVGGMRRADLSETPYSSRPAEDKTTPGLPLIWAACEEGLYEPGILAAAIRSSESVRMNGTSVAAPVVARRLFNLMARKDVHRADMVATMNALVKKHPDVLR